MINKTRINQIARTVLKIGVQKASSELGIKEASLERYVRLFNNQEKKEGVIEPPKILVLDIETLPGKAHIWSLQQQFINPEMIIQDWCILGWAAKWLFSPDLYSDILTPGEATEHNDKRIMQSLWQYLESADVVIGHNIYDFDRRRINGRMMVHHIQPPSFYKCIDTLRGLKKVSEHTSHKLAFINPSLGLTGKIETGGFELWSRCDAGDKESLALMEQYNKGDVLATEELYMELRAWLPNHPNLALYCEGNGECCPKCMGDKLEYTGHYSTYANLYRSYRCLNCGAIVRARTSDTPRYKYPNLKFNVLL
jgi:hypothetical protein